MTPEDYSEFIFGKILISMDEQVASGKITEERAKKIVDLALKSIKPEMTLDELYVAIYRFQYKVPELKEVADACTNEYINFGRMQSLKNLEKFISQKN